MDDVMDFVRREAERPSPPGACCTTADRWFERKRGYSALSLYGRKIESESDAERWLAEPGGIAVAVNRVMRKAGVPKTTDPAAGDIGLIVWEGRMFMAILTPAGWFSRSRDGLIMAPRDAVWKAWSLA